MASAAALGSKIKMKAPSPAPSIKAVTWEPAKPYKAKATKIVWHKVANIEASVAAKVLGSFAFINPMKINPD